MTTVLCNVQRSLEHEIPRRSFLSRRAIDGSRGRYVPVKPHLPRARWCDLIKPLLQEVLRPERGRRFRQLRLRGWSIRPVRSRDGWVSRINVVSSNYHSYVSLERPARIVNLPRFLDPSIFPCYFCISWPFALETSWNVSQLSFRTLCSCCFSTSNFETSQATHRVSDSSANSSVFLISFIILTQMDTRIIRLYIS